MRLSPTQARALSALRRLGQLTVTTWGSAGGSAFVAPGEYYGYRTLWALVERGLATRTLDGEYEHRTSRHPFIHHGQGWSFRPTA